MLNIPQRSRDYWLLWFVALSALALNVWLLNTLLGLRRQAGEAAAVAAQEIKLLRESSFDYTVKIDQSLPISLTIPFKQTFNLPINQTIPISTVIQVPLEIPFVGTRIFDVPLRTSVPITLNVDIPINLIVPISTSVPIKLNVPIRLTIADTPIDATLDRAETYLEDLGGQFGVLTVTPTPQR
ncbi:MAG: hypothetical protein ACT4QE_24215 [Anaerolineales bacterium]